MKSAKSSISSFQRTIIPKIMATSPAKFCIMMVVVNLWGFFMKYFFYHFIITLAVISALSTGIAESPYQDTVGISGLTVSPDGSTLAFSYLGDIWTVPETGGAAQRLTVNPARRQITGIQPRRKISRVQFQPLR